MSRSKYAQLVDECEALIDSDRRYVDMAAQLVVYERCPGVPGYRPVETRPQIYGGRYDTLLGRYVEIEPDAPPLVVQEISCYRGQLELLEFNVPGIARVVALGAPGGGKTEFIARRGVLNGLLLPGVNSGVVTQNQEGLGIVWDKLVALFGPWGWIKHESRDPRNMEIVLWNEHRYQFRAAQKASKKSTSRVAGKDWHAAIEDQQESMSTKATNEVDFRGRVAPNYLVCSTANNENEPEFQERLGEYRRRPELYRVVPVRGDENVFTSPVVWQRLEAILSKADYERLVLCLDVPDEGRLFPMFASSSADKNRPFDSNVRPYPSSPDIGRLDITEQVTFDKYQVRYPYVVGIDFGALTTAMVIMKCLRGVLAGEREWWALHEITIEDRGTDFAAKALIDFMAASGWQPHQFLCVGDPHEYKEVDKSDYRTFKNMGLNIVRASSDQKHVIPYKHRVSMMNALLKAYDGRRRFFVDDGKCERLRKGLGTLMKGPDGKPVRPQQDRHHLGADYSHQVDAAMFGVFPFERIRGVDPSGNQAAAGPQRHHQH